MERWTGKGSRDFFLDEVAEPGMRPSVKKQQCNNSPRLMLYAQNYIVQRKEK